MIRLFRLAALVIAIAAIVEPAFAVRRAAPLPVEVVLTPDGEAGHAEAVRIRDAIVAALGDSVDVRSGDVKRAIVAVGNARVEDVGDATVFAVSAPSAARISPIAAPAIEVLWGQQAHIAPQFRAQQLAGETTTFRLTAAGGAPLASVQHQWKTNDEAFVPSFSYAPTSPGQVTLRVTAEGAAAAVSVDMVVTTLARRARVLVFEPRPSWTAGFARQALEADPLFEVNAVSRTSRDVRTQTPNAPASIAALDPETAEVLMAGGLDALSDRDIEVMVAFAAERGGSVLLVPDGRLPEKVSRAFDVPQLQEVLLQKPMTLKQGGIMLRASELLRPSAEPGSGNAVSVWPKGRGQVVLSLGLDAWRYRAEPDGAFAAFWRAVAADAARAATPPVTVQLDPAIARPGEDVRVTVTMREIGRAPGELGLPAASASIVGTDGVATALRLWPGMRANEYVGQFAAPAAGRYDVRIDLAGFPRHDAVFLSDPNVARPLQDRSRELAMLAAATGGAVIPAADLSRLDAALRAMPGAEESRQVRPTRSAWWMLAFVACLGTEWAVRRSRGLQ